MDKLPDLEQVSEQEKDALIVALWAEVQRLRTRLTALEAKLREPRKEARNASVPPSPTPQANTPRRPPQGVRREARVGRAGGGRPLHPTPDQVLMAKAKICPQCRHGVLAAEQALPAVYDKIERPAVTPIVTRVEPSGGQCTACGQPYVAPVPAGMEPGSPFGASVQRLATYLRYTHAISDERLSALLVQVFGLRIREGGLANLFPSGNVRLDDRIAELLTRLRSRRLRCSDATSARVNGQQQWEWVFQNTEVCMHVSRPSRGHGVIHEILGGHRPTIGVSDLSSAQTHHPAAPWQVGLAHPLRDGQLAIDTGDAVCAPHMKAVWLRALAIHQRRDHCSRLHTVPVPVRSAAACQPLWSAPAHEPSRQTTTETLCPAAESLMPLAGRGGHSTDASRQCARHSHAYRLSEGHPRVPLPRGARPVRCRSLRREYWHTPGNVRLSGPPEGAFPQ